MTPKRARTRERLISVAMRLFLAQGYEATTVDDIVAEAGVSRRSFFYHFRAKEEVVFAWQDDLGDAFAEGLATLPGELSLARLADHAVQQFAAALNRDQALAMWQLVNHDPVLAQRSHAKYAGWERRFAEATAARIGADPGDLTVRLTAMIAMGLLRLASETWLAGGASESPRDIGVRVSAALRAFLGDGAE